MTPDEYFQQKAAATAEAARAFADEVEDGFVGDEIAALHVRQRLVEGGRALGLAKTFGRAENVASGKLARA